jgi:hypothetical protein
MLTNRFAILALAAIASLPLAPAASAARDTCYDVETVNMQDEEGNDLQTWWMGVNNAGVLVGGYCEDESCAVQPAVVYDPASGRVETFMPDGYDYSTWGEINEHGEVAMSFALLGESGEWLANAAFLRDPDGGMTMLEDPSPGKDGIYSSQGINTAGVVVGWYYDSADDRFHGAIWEDGGYTVYDLPGWENTLLDSIANDGSIALATYHESEDPSSVAQDYRSFIDDGRDVTPIDFDGEPIAIEGLNTRGQAVGHEYSTGSARNVLYEDGSFSTLDIEGATWSMAIDINDHGVIVGTWGGDDGFWNGFVATPVPCRRR